MDGATAPLLVPRAVFAPRAGQPPPGRGSVLLRGGDAPPRTGQGRVRVQERAYNGGRCRAEEDDEPEGEGGQEIAAERACVCACVWCVYGVRMVCVWCVYVVCVRVCATWRGEGERGRTAEEPAAPPPLGKGMITEATTPLFLSLLSPSRSLALACPFPLFLFISLPAAEAAATRHAAASRAHAAARMVGATPRGERDRA